MPDALRQRKSYNNYTLLKTSWKYQTREFFENSTLHGVRYIAEKERPIYERFSRQGLTKSRLFLSSFFPRVFLIMKLSPKTIFRIMWFSFVTIGAIVTLIIIVSLWEKFQTNPTITGLDTDFHSWIVPFPGVTICLGKPALTSRVNDYIEKTWGSDLPQDKQEYYSKFVNLISNFSYENMREISPFKADKTIPQSEYRQLLYEVAVRCEDFLDDCSFKQEDLADCCESFIPTFTEKGYCYSFNTFNSEKEWPWKKASTTGGNKSPFSSHRIYETDVTWSLTFKPNISLVDSDQMSVYIHSSNELPGMEMAPQHIWSNQIEDIFFAARTTYTTEDAKQLTIKQRKCVFKNEIKLPSSPEYSYWACMTSCRMDFAKAKCACVPFFYHAVVGYPYCNLDGLACLASYADDLIKGTGCACELGCDNTVYEVEKFNDGEEKNFTLNVGFVSWPMIRYKREVLFGWVDLLVAFGGIAGLFLGFSLLSGVEIIYYFTLRAFCMVYRNKEDLETMKHEEESQDPPKICLDLHPDMSALSSPPSAGTALKGVDQTSAFVSRIVTQGGRSAMKKGIKYPAYPVPFLN